jgi:hypothetical protein
MFFDGFWPGGSSLRKFASVSWRKRDGERGAALRPQRCSLNFTNHMGKTGWLKERLKWLLVQYPTVLHLQFEDILLVRPRSEVGKRSDICWKSWVGNLMENLRPGRIDNFWVCRHRLKDMSWFFDLEILEGQHCFGINILPAHGG